MTDLYDTEPCDGFVLTWEQLGAALGVLVAGAASWAAWRWLRWDRRAT